MIIFLNTTETLIKENSNSLNVMNENNDFIKDVKNSLNEFSGSLSITYNNPEYSIDHSIFRWEGTLSSQIKWFYSYGEGNTGFFITGNLISMNKDLIEVLNKMTGFFNTQFTQVLKGKINNNEL